MGDALCGFIDLLPDEITDRRKVLRQIDVDVVDGGTHLLGLSHKSVALGGEFLQQAADAHLVVAVSALKRCNLIAHQRFELAGARKRALDAVAHGCHFAADRLSDGNHGILRHALGLGEPHGHFRHRLRNQPQFLCAPSHMGQAEEEDDRQQRRGPEADHDGGRRVAGAKRGVEIAQIGPGQRDAADHPDEGEHGGDNIGGARGSVLQRVQDLSDRLLIVIGGAKGLSIAAAGGGLAGVEGHVGGRRRRDVRPAVGGGAAKRLGDGFGLTIRLVVVADFERFLDRRQRCFGRIHDLLGVIGHIGRRLACYAGLGRPEETQAAPRARDRRNH